MQQWRRESKKKPKRKMGKKAPFIGGQKMWPLGEKTAPARPGIWRVKEAANKPAGKPAWADCARVGRLAARRRRLANPAWAGHAREGGWEGSRSPRPGAGLGPGQAGRSACFFSLCFSVQKILREGNAITFTHELRFR